MRPHAQDRVAAGQQPPGDRVEDLVEDLVADATAARQLDQRQRERLAGDRDVPRPERVQRGPVHRVDVPRELHRIVPVPER
jgi:hypothetical protein